MTFPAPDTPPKKNPSSLSEELRVRHAFKKRRKKKSLAEYAREQAFVDWLEAPLPIDEKKGLVSLHDLLMKILPEVEKDFQSPNMQQEQLAEGWKRAAGDFISHNADLVGIQNGAAIVKVLQPSLRYQLLQWQAPLLEKLKKEFPQLGLTSIKFLFG